MNRRLLLPLVLLAGCCTQTQPRSTVVSLAERTPTRVASRTPLERSIRAAAGYLVRSTRESGRFVYRINLDGHSLNLSHYNVLRHAGTIYALSQYCADAPQDTKARAALLRAARYLRKRHVRAVKGVPGVKAVFSLAPEESDSDQPEAKLGGAGLGLVALVSARKLDRSVVSLDDLRGLAKFVRFMQLPSGKFRSKYEEVKKFANDFESLYYPGEAILGLVMLYEVDPDPRWLETAARAIAFLVKQRAKQTWLPNDHWLMIAGARLLPRYGDLKAPPLPIEQVRAHVIALGKEMLREQRRVGKRTTDPAMQGAFNRDGRSCPTATRLEGLVALESFLDRKEEAALKRELQASIKSGAAFLRRCQVVDGLAAGGIKAALKKLPGKKRFNRYQAEVRVDYVQHALSALVGQARIAARTK